MASTQFNLEVTLENTMSWSVNIKIVRFRVLTVVAVKVFFFLLLCKMTSKQYSLFCYRAKTGKINCFENVGFAEVKHRLNYSCILHSA
jgi:hypothetical protein